MIAQRDSVNNIRLGESSLAVSKASTNLARSNQEVAIATSRDSAVMRTIGAVTMIFLPATFTAVSKVSIQHTLGPVALFQSISVII